MSFGSATPTPVVMDVEPVALAALDDFGVAGGYGDSGLCGGAGHRLDLTDQDFGVQSFFYY